MARGAMRPGEALVFMTVCLMGALLGTVAVIPVWQHNRAAQRALTPGRCVVTRSEVVDTGTPTSPRAGIAVGFARADGVAGTAIVREANPEAAGITMMRFYPVGRAVDCFATPAGTLLLDRPLSDANIDLALALFFDATFGGFFAFTVRRYARARRGLGR